MASSVEPVPGPRVRRAVFAAAVLAFLLAAGGLLSGRPWLGDPTRLSGIPAGNVALNFQGGGRLLAWLAYTGAMLVLPVPLMAGTAWAGLAAGRREQDS